MAKRDALLNQNITREIAHMDFVFNDADNEVAQEMIREINTLGYEFHYLAEIETYKIPGSGCIISKYINRFSEEATRAYLVAQIIADSDNVKDCERTVLQLYLHFKSSNDYISEPGVPAPAHIYVRYDNAFKNLRPKKLKDELLTLVSNPRDAFYLPLTTRMLASWKLPGLKDLLVSFLDDSVVTAQSVGIREDSGVFYPSLEFMRRELKFTAIDGLKYYSSAETISLIKQRAIDSDLDIKLAAKKALKAMEKGR